MQECQGADVVPSDQKNTTADNGRAYSAPESPRMPEFRVQECVPFSYVGLDYAGPLYVKNKEVGVKVWIALFTCGVS